MDAGRLKEKLLIELLSSLVGSVPFQGVKLYRFEY